MVKKIINIKNYFNTYIRYIYTYIYNIAVAQSFFVSRTIQHKKILTTDFNIITFCISII